MNPQTIPNDIPEHLLDILPETMLELIDIAGMSKAIKLVQLRGGTRLIVPQRGHSDAFLQKHWFAQATSVQALKELIDIAPGEVIDIPRCQSILQALKEQAIFHAAKNGATESQLAIKYGMTERGIRKLKKRVRTAEHHQASLFE